jgi:hypothetical protein
MSRNTIILLYHRHKLLDLIISRVFVAGELKVVSANVGSATGFPELM